MIVREEADEHESRLGDSSSSATLGRIWIIFECILAGGAASDLFVGRERRLRLGRILLCANTVFSSAREGKGRMHVDLRDAIVGVVRIYEDRERRLAQSNESVEDEKWRKNLSSRSFSILARLRGLLCAGPHCLPHPAVEPFEQ